MSVVSIMEGSTSPHENRPLNYATAMLVGLVLASGMVLTRKEHNRILLPSKKARVISQINRHPDQFSLMLQQCGFDPVVPEARGKKNCVLEEYDVSQQSYQSHPEGSLVKPKDLEQP